MRVISGEFGGRRLQAVSGSQTRPTADKVKESLFNMLGPYFAGGQALDLYAGTGALGIEAVSRGMRHATLVDRQLAAIKTIKANVKLLKAETQFTVIKAPVAKALTEFGATKRQFDLIMADPPYAEQAVFAELTRLRELDLIAPGGRVVFETGLDVTYPAVLPGYHQVRHQTYGVAQVMILTPA